MIRYREHVLLPLPNMSGRQLTFIRVRLPPGAFFLAYDAAGSAHTQPAVRYDGPFESVNAVYDDDNALVLLGEGLPYRIGVVAQNDDLLELRDGSTARIEPCVTEDRTA